MGAGLLFKYKRSSKGRPFISHQEKNIYAEQINKDENIKDIYLQTLYILFHYVKCYSNNIRYVLFLC